VVFDVEQHEQNKLNFLEALYSMAQERMASHPDAGDPTLIEGLEAEIGKRAGLSRPQAERINSDLEHEGMTEFVAGVGPDGPMTCFTRQGLNLIERHLYERSKQEAVRQGDQPELEVPYDQAETASREFSDLASDLTGSDFSEFITNFNHFYEFINEDAVMRRITADLRNHPAVDIDKWLADFKASGGAMVGSHSYHLSRDTAAQAATILQLYGKIYDDKVDVLDFARDAYGTTQYDECIYKFNESITRKFVRILEQRLEALVNQAAARRKRGGQSAMATDRVFVVHGHDDLTKVTVARFIERLGLQAIILHEQANLGKTIIEKLEHHADVGFAVILLTPDDVGASKAAHQAGQPLNDRARQNVIFEHGCFIGKLGRDKVCALYKGVEIPSDLQGVLYVPLDDAGAWKLSLAKEMQAAGMNVDLNKAL
jgi:predicted nucleotide-binding protein